MKKSQRHQEGFAAATAAFEDGVARICRLYGVNPLLGRLYAILFLATEPLALDELCRRVGAAKSTVSVTLRRLLALRLVRRLPPHADRRDFYEAVTDPWTIVADWSRLFLTPEIEMWRQTGNGVERALGASDAPRGAVREALRERVAGMTAFVELFETLLADLSRTRPAIRPARTIAITVERQGRRK